jgi:lysophospholipid acyltransferase (LPLAT)-like uncharacterized protein
VKWRKALKLRSPLAIAGAAFGAAGVIRALTMTLRVRVRTCDGQSHPLDPATQPCIYAFWHEAMLAPCKVKVRVQALASQSADGELIAQVLKRLGVGVIRGSSSKGGAGVLLDLSRQGAARDSHLLITPDGPRGPRRTVQPGIVFLASKSGLPIVPVGVGFTRAWRARSWDRFAVPLPFSTLLGVIGAPIHIPDRLTAEGLNFHRRQVETQMLELTSAAERWAMRGAACAPETSVPQDSGDTRHAA